MGKNNMKCILFIGACAVLKTMASSSVDHYNLLMDSISSTFSEDYVTGTDGYPAVPFDDSHLISVPLQDITKSNTALSTPMIINTVFRLDEEITSYLFSIIDEGVEKLSLSLSPAGEEITRATFVHDGFPTKKESFVFSGGLKNQWIKLLLHVETKSVSLWTNCSRINDIIDFDDDIQDLYFSESALLFLGQSGAADKKNFKGAVQEIKIYPNANNPKLICDENPELLESFFDDDSPPDKDLREIKGDKGDKGEKGESITGPQGIEGPKGPPGLPGSKGEQGKCECSESLISSLVKGMPELRGLPGDPGPRGDIGNPGRPGITGQQGDPGERGPQGLKGDRGERGDEGKVGQDGSKGVKGDPGNDGLPGPPGPPGPGYKEIEAAKELIRGEQGVAGPIGPPGPPGIQGVAGEKGQQGIKGEKGDRGHKGSEGNRGEKGDQGHAGKDGIPGRPGEHGRPAEKGQKGESGDVGATGPPGVSEKFNIEYITKNDELIQKLKGQKGEKGLSGEKGEKGLNGMPGNDGKNGVPGVKGETGPIGPMGYKGERGEPGLQSNISAAELAKLKGSKGDRGPTGKSGSRGPTGAPGKRGPSGPKGAKGDTGSMGPIGPPGEKGVRGEKGEQGECTVQFNVTQVKGEKGDIGASGPPGPPGPIGTDTRYIPLPGPPGPPGPPGSPASSGASTDKIMLSDKNILSDDTKNDEFYTASTIVYQTTTALIQMGSTFEARESDLKLLPQANPTERSHSSITAEDDSTSIISKRTFRKFIDRSKAYIRLAALNEPYSGNMVSQNNQTGRRAADHECYRQSERAGVRSTFAAFLANEIEDLKRVMRSPKDWDRPVVNLNGKILFESWSSMFNGSGAVFANSADIVSFNGKKVLIDPTWPKKVIWHGGTSSGVRSTKAFCEEWRSDSPKHFGAASSLHSNKLLGQEMFSCDNKLIVLCVEVKPSFKNGQRHMRSRRRLRLSQAFYNTI